MFNAKSECSNAGAQAAGYALRGLPWLVLAIVAAPGAARAAEENAVIDEIVVTGYLRREAESAMKALVPIRDTPFTVSTYGEELLKDIEAETTLDAYKYMTGVNRGGQSAWDLSLRGFKTTSNDRHAIMADGLPGQTARFGSPPAFAIDRIEVVKGPASVLYGKAQPGGFVNIIYKKPIAEAHQKFGLRGTTYDGGGSDLFDHNGGTAQLDINGPLDSGEGVLFRIVGEYRDGDSFRDFVSEKSKFIMPAITFNMSDDTRLTLWGDYRHREANYDLYLAAPDRDLAMLKQIPISTRYQEPDDLQTEEGHQFSMALTHHFDNDMRLQLNARRVRNHDFTKWYDSSAVLEDQRTLRRTARIGDNHRINDYFDASLATPFGLGAVEHKVVLGINGGIDSLDAFRRQFFSGPELNIDLFDPVHGIAPRHEDLPTGNQQRRFTQTKAFGVYLTDFISFGERWKGVAGLRYDQERLLFREIVPVPLEDVKATESDIYPMAGLMFQPNDQWSFYGSYSTSFVPPPPNFQDVSGGHSFQPEQGSQFEVGVKAYFLEEKVGLTVALFDIEKKNTLAVVPCDPGIAGTCHAEVGAEESSGIEFEGNFRPIGNWQTLFGFAYIDAKIKKQSGTGANVPLQGSQLTNAPKHTANLWTRYDFLSQPLDKLSVGGGLVYVGKQVGNHPSLANPKVLTLPSYVVAEAALYYVLTQRIDLALRINNILDERYFESVGSTFHDRSVVPGTPRSIVLSFNVEL